MESRTEGQFIFWVGLGGKAWDFITLLRTAHNLKLRNSLFLNFQLSILDHGWLWVAETMERETMNKRWWLYPIPASQTFVLGCCAVPLVNGNIPSLISCFFHDFLWQHIPAAITLSQNNILVYLYQIQQCLPCVHLL